MFGLIGTYDIIVIMFISHGFFCGGFIPKYVRRWQRWLLAALTYIILIAVISAIEYTFPSTCRHPEEDF